MARLAQGRYGGARVHAVSQGPRGIPGRNLEKRGLGRVYLLGGRRDRRWGPTPVTEVFRRKYGISDRGAPLGARNWSQTKFWHPHYITFTESVHRSPHREIWTQ